MGLAVFAVRITDTCKWAPSGGCCLRSGLTSRLYGTNELDFFSNKRPMAEVSMPKRRERDGFPNVAIHFQF